MPEVIYQIVNNQIICIPHTPIAIPCEDGNEHLVSWKEANFLINLVTTDLLRNTQPVPVATRSETHVLMVWTLRPWVRIPLKACIFVRDYSSSFTCYSIIDAI
jgi:hypothetical protein